MEKDRNKFIFGESLDATTDTSVAEENVNESVNYQTADEENSSKYYSVIEDDSTLENISSSDLSVRIDKETSDGFEIAGESSVDRPFETDLKTLNILDSLSNMDVESVNKFNIHETVETDDVLRPSMDIFDDNESSVDGHELIIDDDPQPDEKSDDCTESGAEASTDMQYVEDTSESIDSAKNLGFGALKKTRLDVTPESTLQETKTSCSEENDSDDSPKQIIDVKIFTEDSGDTEMKSESYNFPEGSHRVTLVIDGNNVEAINIGQNIYIYTDSNGELTAFQVIKDNGNPSIKYLHVGKNEDGNIEVYEEQVNQITITPENADFAKEKEISTSTPNSDSGKNEPKSSVDLEKTSQDLIKAVMNQEKLSLSTNLKNPIFNCESKTPLLSDKEILGKVDQYKNCKVMLNDKLKLSNENDPSTDMGCENNSIEPVSKKLLENKTENVTTDVQLCTKDVTVIPKTELESIKSDDVNSSPSKDSEKLKIVSKTSLLFPSEVIGNKKNVLDFKENSVDDSFSREKLTSFYSDQSIDYNENEKKTNKTLMDNFSLENSSKLDKQGIIDNCKRQDSKPEPFDASKIETVIENECLENSKNVMENKSVSPTVEKIKTTAEKLKKFLGFGKDNSRVTNENSKNKSISTELKVNDVSVSLQKSPLENFNSIDGCDKIMKIVNSNFTAKTAFSKSKIEELPITSVDLKNKGVSPEKSLNLLSSEIDKDQSIDKFKILKTENDSLHNTSNLLNSKEEKCDLTNKNEKECNLDVDIKINEGKLSNDEKISIETVIKEEKHSPYHNTELTKCVIDTKIDNDKRKSSPNKDTKCEDSFNVEISKTVENALQKNSLVISSQSIGSSKNDSQINLESDDEFEEEYIEGEPVTGDSGVDWSDGNVQNDISKLNVAVIQVELTDKDNFFNSVEINDNIEVDKLSDDSNNLLIVESNIPSETVNENIESLNISDIPEKILVIDSSESPNILKNVSLIENDSEKDKNEDIVNAEEIENILNDSCTDVDDEMNEETVTLHIVDSNVSTDDMNSMTTPFSTKQVILDYGKSQEYITKACEQEDPDVSFKGFCLKPALKTYSREVKPTISSPNKSLSNVSIKLAPQICVNSETKETLKSLNTSPLNIITSEESVGNVAQKSLDLKDSPKQKSRQPRKQVFTTVAKSDIEFIFSGCDDAKAQNVAKTAKTYSRSKHKEIGAEKIKPNISNPIKIDDKKVANAIPKVDNKDAKNVESLLDENNKKSIPESFDKVPEIVKKENDEKKITEEKIDAPNGIQENEKNKSASISPLPNSAKRKRGRPKKILSPNSSVFESLILDVDGSPRQPSVKTPVKSKIETEKQPEVKSNEITPLKEEIVNESLDKNNEKIDEKSTSSVEETGKRKKGRPKKILSLSLDESNNTDSISNDLKRKSLPDMDHKTSNDSQTSNDSTNSDNICPICSKSFRSPNVLLKHAKHCNGAINVEAFKSPKRKKMENKMETVEESNIEIDDTSISQESQPADFDLSVISSKFDDKETDDSVISVSKIVDVSSNDEVMSENREIISKPEIIITESIEDKSCEEITIDDDKLPEENIENVTESQTKHVSNQSSINTKNTKLDDTKPSKGKLPKKVDATNSKLSPMSRLSKFLNTKPPANKVIKCEICNKTFRQLAHMVYHRNKHDEEKQSNPTPPEKPVRKSIEQQVQKSECDAILKCEICKKGFRKLHHLVEHREMHANLEIKSRRASTVSVKSEPEAGFRCDTCDKSFRKLHHLVAHRDLHLSEGSELNSKPTPEVKTVEKEIEKDGATCSGCGKSFRKRHHMVEHRDTHCSPKKKRLSEDSEFSDSNVRLSITSSTSDETNNCGICGKSYRKLHHMIEHRESHTELVVKSEHRVSTRFSSPDSLNTKDIIHECSKCYMVFPNVNSLNKHIDNCSRKKLMNKKSISNENTKSNKSVVKSSNVEANKPSKLPKFEDLPKPSTSKIVKTKISTKKNDVGNNSLKTITRAKSKSSDNEVKYKINPDFKGKADSSASTNNVSKPKSKLSESIFAHLKVPSARMLKTIIEETTVKYSFPKSPKSAEKPKVESKLPKSNPRKSIATKTISKPTLAIRRRSLGGRKSLEIKKMIKESEPRQKLQRKTIASLKETAEKNTKKDLYKCDCGKQFENNTLLKKHMDAEHTPPKSYKCHECGVSVRTAVQFSKHKKTHDDTHANQSDQKKRNKPSTSSASASAKNKGATPKRDIKKLKDAHRGVPLSDKMKKAFLGSKV